VRVACVGFVVVTTVARERTAFKAAANRTDFLRYKVNWIIISWSHEMLAAILVILH